MKYITGISSQTLELVMGVPTPFCCILSYMPEHDALKSGDSIAFWANGTLRDYMIFAIGESASIRNTHENMRLIKVTTETDRTKNFTYLVLTL